MPYVRWSDFEQMPVLIPKPDIAEMFNQITKPIVGKINNLAMQIIYLTEVRDSLLPKLINEEIEV